MNNMQLSSAKYVLSTVLVIRSRESPAVSVPNNHGPYLPRPRSLPINVAPTVVEQCDVVIAQTGICMKVWEQKDVHLKQVGGLEKAPRENDPSIKF